MSSCLNMPHPIVEWVKTEDDFFPVVSIGLDDDKEAVQRKRA